MRWSIRLLLARDPLRDRDPVLRGPVGEHGPGRAVADRPDAIAARAAELVDPDEPAFVALDARLLEAEPLGDGPASDRDHEPVHLDPVRSLRVLVVDGHRFGARLAAGDPLAEPDVEALAAEDPEGLLRDLPVRGGEEVLERFEQHHPGPEAVPDASELEADDPRPDDGEARRRLLEGEGALGVHDALPVRRGRGDGGRHRPGREDHVPGTERPRRGARHLDRAVPGQAGRAGDDLDAVLLEKARDPAAKRRDDLVFPGLHRGHVDPCAFHGNPMTGKEMRQVVKVVRRVEEGLRRDAPDVEAGPPEGRPAPRVRPLVDAHGSQSKLGAADRGDVAAGAGADDGHVERGRIVRGVLAGGHAGVRPRGAGGPDLPPLP